MSAAIRMKSALLPLLPLLGLLLLLSAPALAADVAGSNPATGPATGIDPADPMVRVTAPHLKVDAPAVLAALSRDVAAATGLKEEYVTYYWQTFDAIHCMGQPATDKPIFVDLYVPGFFSDEQVSGMMTAIANSLSRLTNTSTEWVFVHTHFPLQGQVYISGHVEHWDTYRGKPATASAPRPQSDRAVDKFMFNDGAFVFQSRWRFGLTYAGASDLGELLAITAEVKDFDKESWHQAWYKVARKVQAQAEAYAASGHALSAKEAYFRATNYYRASAVYLFGKDPRALTTWQDGRNTFLKAAALTGKTQGPRIKPVRIPYEKTTLPGYLVTPEGPVKKRPLLLIQTGLDGTAEDLYFIIGDLAVRRGYTCLIYEGPGQGEMITKQDIPFRYDWEKVVTPVVDFAQNLPEVDAKRMAIIGYSMGGYLVPRALAFEKRIRWGIADGGVMSVYEGTMTKFPEAVRAGISPTGCTGEVDPLALKEMEKHPELSQFINQMFLTFHADTPCALFQKLSKFDQSGTVGQIRTEMLVVNSSEDQVAGSNAQAKKFYNALKTAKTYMEFDAEQGTQFHCQLGAPLASGAAILNWLDERAKP